MSVEIDNDSQIIKSKVRGVFLTEGFQSADLPPHSSAWCKCKVNLTGVSVPGDVSVYFRSLHSHYHIILHGHRGGGV